MKKKAKIELKYRCNCGTILKESVRLRMSLPGELTEEIFCRKTKITERNHCMSSTYVRIQNILLPEVGVCSEKAMFFQEKKPESIEWDVVNNQLIFEERRSECSFSTYFNGLSIGKWKKYTEIGKVRLCLLLRGEFQVVFKQHCKVKGIVSHDVIRAVQVKGDGLTPVAIPYTLYDCRGIIGFSLIAQEKHAAFIGGWYEAEVDGQILQDVNLALNICTFRREPFILRNIRLLTDSILNNPDSPLFDHLQLFISDNGKTLPIEELNSGKVHIVPNKNVGGAGGFSRGMLEIMKHSEDFPATHVIMMDDDIIIETESLFRTYMLLRCRKPKYASAFVGGAMLRLDQPTVQVESGASWNGGRLISNKAGLKLSSLDACLDNEVEEYTEYNAWWFCCTPIRVIRDDNLPLPIFIRGDDLEYGLRNMESLILLNGICVWHEPFENKYSSFLQYYILRNQLYDNALHCRNYGKRKLLRDLYRKTLSHLVRYRYKDALLTMRGVSDFLKGTDFLLHADGEKLHKEIMACGYKAEPIENLNYAFHYPDYDASLRENDSRLHRIFRLMTGNGFLLPSRKQYEHEAKCVSMASCRPVNFFRQNVVLNYDAASGKAFITKKSYRKTLSCMGRLLGTTACVLLSYDRAKQDFAKNYQKLTNASFWTDYLAE